MNKLKSFFVFSLALATLFAANVFAADIASIDSGSAKNGSVIVNFSDEVRALYAQDFRLELVYAGTTKIADITKYTAQDNSYKKYKLFYAPIEGNGQSVTANLSYQGGAAYTYTFNSDAVETINFEIINKTNGAARIRFEADVPNLEKSDFNVSLYVDGSRRSYEIERIDSVSGSPREFDIVFPTVRVTNVVQKIEIELQYSQSRMRTVSYYLYPNGSISDSNIGGDYSHLPEANFTVRGVSNGEIFIRFKQSVNTFLTKDNFSITYYIDGIKKGDLAVKDAQPENGNSFDVDYKIFFDPILSTDKKQTVTLLVFYTKVNNQPSVFSYDIEAYRETNEVIISVDEVVKFDKTARLAKIVFEERAKNLIYPSPDASGILEYLQMEAPEGYEWNLKTGKVSGTGGLKNARESKLAYAVQSGSEKKNILNVSLTGIDSNRSDRGTLALENFEFTAANNATLGSVRVRIGGAGIAYERISVAELIEPENKETLYTVVFTLNSDILIVNGKQSWMDTKVFSDENNRLMVPVSHIAFAFGINPTRGVGWDWDDVSRTATIKENGKTIQITQGSALMRVNGVNTLMDTVAVIRDDRIFIPARFLGEALGFNFDWNDAARTATASRIIKQ
jgi:hypothetical protein